MILTARESEKLRDEIIQYGISQIDGGTKIEIGSYVEKEKNHNLNKGQFKINDDRSLNEVIDELLNQEMLPSFCTSCYRLGRTGEHFMEFSVPGFIKQFCTPNAILTLAEYLTAVSYTHLDVYKRQSLYPVVSCSTLQRYEILHFSHKNIPINMGMRQFIAIFAATA